jgi:hypothetical protein
MYKISVPSRRSIDALRRLISTYLRKQANTTRPHTRSVHMCSTYIGHLTGPSCHCLYIRHTYVHMYVCVYRLTVRGALNEKTNTLRSKSCVFDSQRSETTHRLTVFPPCGQSRGLVRMCEYSSPLRMHAHRHLRSEQYQSFPDAAMRVFLTHTLHFL